MASKQQKRTSPTAVAYAQSLLELGVEQNNQHEQIAQDLAALEGILEQNPGAEEMFANPAVGVEEREQVLDRIFRNNVSPLLFQTLAVMNQHGRLGLLSQMITAYQDLLDEVMGKVEVDLTTSSRLDAGQLESARQKISVALGRDAVIHPYVNENIIGGMVIRVGDKLIDASVRAQLEAMKHQLLAAAPK